jgi:aldehyde oxidoreductase
MKNIKPYSQIVTIEGIGTPQNLHPLQLAWIVYGGVQCGFCTPGFIVSAKGLLDSNPNPTREDVRDWFQKHRNACRCTGYRVLVDATMAAAEVLRGEKTMDDLAFKIPDDQRIYGTAYPRPAALAKVCGTCDYGADINDKLPKGEALRLAVAFADVHRAKIKSINIADAEQAPGVVKVITAKDIQGNNRIFFPCGSPRCLSNGMERPILCDEKVFHYGDPLAIVAADTEENARAAVALIKTEYELLPAYLNALDAIADDAEQIHEGMPNLYLEMPVYKGEDTRPIIENSAVVHEGSYYSQHQPHLVIEPDVALSYMDEEGRLTIHCKSLAIGPAGFFIHFGIGLTPDKIRIIENPTGASFGYSISPGTVALMAAATMATDGRPCTLCLNYAEHQRFTGKRAASYANIRMAADAQGKLTALEFEIAYDKGAYTEVTDVASKGIRFVGAPYYVPNVIGLSKAVVTNNAYSTAFRGFGGPQALNSSEAAIDELAEQLGIDPLEIRYINVYKPGETTNNGYPLDVYPMQGLIDLLRPHYEEIKARVERFNASTPEGKRRGVGVSCANYNVTGGINDHCEAAVELMSDGGVAVYDSWEDQGQGGDIGTLVHAHESLRPLGIKPEQIRLIMNDTAITPESGPAAASRSNYMVGNAILDASNKLIAAMTKSDGSFRTYQEMKDENLDTYYLGVYDTAGMGVDLDVNTGQGDPTPTYTYAFYVAEVEVDTNTGKTHVLEMHCASDVGVVSSKQALDGQAYGGMVQSIGLALYEDYVDPEKDVSLVKCGFPFIKDVPDELYIAYTETPRLSGPHGSGGASEVYISGGHVSVLNAIKNAVGVRIHELPATPAKILTALQSNKTSDLDANAKYWLGSDLHETIDYIKANPMVSKEEKPHFAT